VTLVVEIKVKKDRQELQDQKDHKGQKDLRVTKEPKVVVRLVI
jgi:hypothetical protein